VAIATDQVAGGGHQDQRAGEASRLALPALVFASASAQLSLVVANPILVEIARSFHLPLALVAQARTLQGAGSAAAALLATLVADRFPRRHQLLLGLAGMAATALALSVIGSFPIWLLVQILSGAASGLVALACAAAAGDYFTEARRGTAIGGVFAGMGLAWLVGLPVAGFVAGAWGWRSAYAMVVVAAAAGLAAIAVVLRPLPRLSAPGGSLLSGWHRLLGHRAARGLLLGDALTHTAWSGFLIYLGPFFALIYGLRSSAVGTMLSLASLAGLVGVLSAAPLARRFGGRRMLLASTIAAGVAIAAPLGAVLTPLVSLAIMAPYVFLSCIRLPASGTIALSLLPEARGTMVAAHGFVIAAAAMTGSALCAALFTAGGFAAIGLGCAALTIAGAYAYSRALAEAPGARTLGVAVEVGSRRQDTAGPARRRPYGQPLYVREGTAR